MVERAAGRIAEEIVASAPAGWTRAILASTAGRGGVSVSGGYAVPGAPLWRNPVRSPFRELGRLAEALRKVRGWERTTLEIECRPSGEFRLVATADAITSLRGRGGGFQVVLDPGYRLPQPGFEQEEGAAAPEGDPELAVARFRAYMERRAAILGRPEQLPPPASAAALDEAERRVGRPLPADLRALYSVADGDALDHEHRYLLGDKGWMALKDLVAVHAERSEPARHSWELAWHSVVFDTDPSDTVRRCGGHPAWLPFATGEDGNYLAVDLAPARNGRFGQVIRIGRDYDAGPAYVADSITSLLGDHLIQLEQGAYEQDGEYITLLEPARRLGPERIVGEIPDEIPPALQAIHINDAAGPVDLTPLTAAPNLRLLHLNRSATADLTPMRALPVESARVTLDGGDLTPLEGHRRLTSLDLDSAAPVDIAPLRTIPNLRCLDLSRADVRDLTVLADLPDLRYLALTARQWTALLDEGKAPPTLAAARLADEDATLDEALTWSARLGLNTEDALRTHATLTRQ
ncbi:SMI1/KNR4 family protein [Streptomyces sp. ME19-01-6]|uniref:SMI1/KNR4 family protein n=1 Tax=Streptomyces sp. ME19-01-6 TaxID=3028686 RepID=UPI0029A995D0|nr:SMI1/KNR4 family protein [Streptomyces sp. ME19-01-6]MDX3232193.1 SMI1/KNR4 family protein [Streptomyces sp. ME19-01-6]